MTLRERLLRTDTVLLDGATGTELARRGIDTGLPLWSARALVDDAGCGALAAIHVEYARAGAEVLTTNTFRTTPRALRKAGWESRWVLFNRRAVELARAAARTSSRPCLVAGGIAPLEDCYACDLVPPQSECMREHLRQADLLARLGVDLLLVETMNTGREARAALAAARAVGIDVLLALCPGAPDRLLSGESLGDTLPRLVEAGADRLAGVLLNCATPAVLAEALPGLRALAGALPCGVYAHLGEPDPITGWRLPADQDPAGYATWAMERVAGGARLIGGCCGTTPAHIASVAAALAAGRSPAV